MFKLTGLNYELNILVVAIIPSIKRLTIPEKIQIKP